MPLLFWFTLAVFLMLGAVYIRLEFVQRKAARRKERK